MGSNKKYQLVLASKSPRRKELLGYTGLSFVIDSCDVAEVSDATDPREFCEEIAHKKGDAVFEKIKAKSNAHFVISSDTIVVLDNVIYGKPKDEQDARKILMELSGKTHSVFTAVSFFFFDAFTGQKKVHAFSEETKVSFKDISSDLLDNYIATKDSLDKAGAYGIQGPSLTFIHHLDGSYSNVVGFPLDRVIEEMKLVLGETDEHPIRLDHFFEK